MNDPLHGAFFNVQWPVLSVSRTFLKIVILCYESLNQYVNDD